MKKFVDTFREHWKRFGCSIMSDGWTDGKKRHLINFLVNCPKASVFLKFVDASNRTNDADFIRKLVKEVIADVGAENMMLEELGAKLPRIKTTVILGKRPVTYIYAHFQELSLMRELTKADLHRSTKTRFATQYYILESIQKYKTPMKMVFVSNRWEKTRFARETVGVNALKIVTNSKFWEDVDYSCRVLKPLVKVVRLMDIERKPTMPCFYEAMRIARDQLEKNLSEDNDTWDIVKDVFDKIWKNNFNHPLHCDAYYLNPSIFYKIPAHMMDNDPKYIEIKRGLHAAMERLITNEDELELATTEL
ncbi:uncharacterized protein LOC113306206 [Papaver somniferum]|uniref:uncharacterized protein LOC113306206 n=1 Tax=Papaver somniferum TaxID=3469 RepID=UPI000E704397|nr:uncharacterized protein LOC113306206 [Papaver somniferum]